MLPLSRSEPERYRGVSLPCQVRSWAKAGLVPALVLDLLEDGCHPQQVSPAVMRTEGRGTLGTCGCSGVWSSASPPRVE